MCWDLKYKPESKLYMFYSKICIVLPARGNTLIWEEHKV